MVTAATVNSNLICPEKASIKDKTSNTIPTYSLQSLDVPGNICYAQRKLLPLGIDNQNSAGVTIYPDYPHVYCRQSGFSFGWPLATQIFSPRRKHDSHG